MTIQPDHITDVLADCFVRCRAEALGVRTIHELDACVAVDVRDQHRSIVRRETQLTLARNQGSLAVRDCPDAPPEDNAEEDYEGDHEHGDAHWRVVQPHLLAPQTKPTQDE